MIKNTLAPVACGIASLALVFALSGCAEKPKEAEQPEQQAAPVATAVSDAVPGTETEPTLEPADHVHLSKQDAQTCYACHGAGENSNPMLANAVALPVGHYVDNDPSTLKLAPVRYQCYTCHSIDANKPMRDDARAVFYATLAEADIETDLTQAELEEAAEEASEAAGADEAK